MIKDILNREIGKLPESIKTMDGMSGVKFREFLNDLIEDTPDARYLEIGSWKGSTACSAMFGNKIKMTCIDNWSEHNGRDGFTENTNQYKTKDTEITLIEDDFRNVDYKQIGKFNVYFFDGPHSEQDQYDGIVMVQDALDDEFLLIVDDYNIFRIQDGTKRAIKDLDLTILDEETVLTSTDGSQPLPNCQNSDWHNGVYIARVKKNKGL